MARMCGDAAFCGACDSRVSGHRSRLADGVTVCSPLQSPAEVCVEIAARHTPRLGEARCAPQPGDKEISRRRPQSRDPLRIDRSSSMSSTAADYIAQALAQGNPDYAKGSATGAMNFLVFVLERSGRARVGWLLQKLAGGAALSLDVFVKADGVLCSPRSWWPPSSRSSSRKPARRRKKRIDGRCSPAGHISPRRARARARPARRGGGRAPARHGATTGHLQYGGYMALGALPAGFASFQRRNAQPRGGHRACIPWNVGVDLRRRLHAAAAAWLLVPIVAAWAYFTGLPYPSAYGRPLRSSSGRSHCSSRWRCPPIPRKRRCAPASCSRVACCTRCSSPLVEPGAPV